MPRAFSPLRILLITLLALAAPLRPAAAFTTAEAKLAMTATLVRSDAVGCGADCPEWLQLTGKIGFGTPSILSAALARLKGRRVPVLLDSPGGESMAALAMGRMIRARKLDTVVAGTLATTCDKGDAACLARLRAGLHPGHIGFATPACASACVLVLASGTDRAVPPAAYVGVHQAMRVLTYRPVVNTFRILSRRVGGRVVVISRTLVATRALPTRVVKGAAPKSVYSEFDRYLLGMGIDESIMPLMRATPPSGIHWLSRPEMGTTRISTDTTEASILVARGPTPPLPPRGIMALAAVTLADGRRWMGIVDWHVDRSSPNPTLVGVVDVPERRLHGSVTIRRATEPAATDGFTLVADVVPPGDAPPAADLQPPQLCDPLVCDHPVVPVSTTGPGGRRFAIPHAWSNDFLTELESRSWLKIDMIAEGGIHGAISLSLFDGAHGVVDDWERLCCGRAASSSGPTEPPPWPDRPPAPVPPPPAVTAAVADVAVPFVLEGQPGATGSTAGIATLKWTEPRQTDPATAEGAAALTGIMEIEAAGLHLSLRAVPASADGRAAGMGGTLLVLSFLPDPARFGPTAKLAIPPIWGPDSHVALLAAISDASLGGGYDVTLTVASDIPPDAALALEFSDPRGRSLTLTIPVRGALARLLEASKAPTG